jgi:hypothetical protein
MACALLLVALDSLPASSAQVRQCTLSPVNWTFGPALAIGPNSGSMSETHTYACLNVSTTASYPLNAYGGPEDDSWAYSGVVTCAFAVVTSSGGAVGALVGGSVVVLLIPQSGGMTVAVGVMQPDAVCNESAARGTTVSFDAVP